MVELYVLMRGQHMQGNKTPAMESTVRAFRTKEEMIEYVRKYVHDNINALSRYGYVRIPAENEFIAQDKIYYALERVGMERYFKYDICKL